MTGNNWKVWGTVLASVGVNLASLILSAPSQAAFIYVDDSTVQNEGSDLSGDRFNPTDLGELMVGDNFLTITIANPVLGTAPTSDRDLDYSKFTVPEGVNFSQAILEDYILGDNAGFFAIQAGDQFTQPPTPPIPPDGPADPSQLLGYSIYGTIDTYQPPQGTPLDGTPLPPNTVTNVGDDFLALMGLTQSTGRAPLLPNQSPAPDPIGFTAPLPPGDYVFWAQQTTFLPADSQLTQFTIRFVGTPIPEPTSIISLIGVSALGLGIMNRQHN